MFSSIQEKSKNTLSFFQYGNYHGRNTFAKFCIDSFRTFQRDKVKPARSKRI